MSKNNFEKQTGRDEFFKELDKEEKKLINPTTGEVFSDLVKKISCPLCGSDKHNILFKKRGFNFVRCEDCSIIFTNPRFVNEKLVKSYQDEKSIKLWKDILLSPVNVETNKKNYGILLDIIKKYKNSGKLLDIGCSYGYFLKMARDQGFIVEGVELEGGAVEYARKKYKIKIHRKELASCNFNKEEFDVVATLGLLEHVPNPLAFLKNINSLLNNKGLIVLTLPNVESLLCMVLKEKARTFTGRNHLTYFSLRTLSEMLKRAGFEIIFRQTYVSGINSIVNELQLLDPFSDLELKYLPKNFIKLLENEKDKDKLDKVICDLGLGYKLRVIAQKVNS